jgi:hypothetical protein
MGYVIKIEGDFREVDPNQLEGFLQSLVESASGEPVQRVVFSGVLKSEFDAAMKQLRG